MKNPVNNSYYQLCLQKMVIFTKMLLIWVPIIYQCLKKEAGNFTCRPVFLKDKSVI
jgi:hypothetical protein